MDFLKRGMMQKTTTEIFSRLQADGLHYWSNCNLPEVDYLKKEHRHIFHFECRKEVSHSDRDIEFIILKHDIEDFLYQNYYNEDKRLLDFKGMSCEDIAKNLLNNFNLTYCSVSEDNENGAIVKRERK